MIDREKAKSKDISKSEVAMEAAGRITLDEEGMESIEESNLEEERKDESQPDLEESVITQRRGKRGGSPGMKGIKKTAANLDGVEIPVETTGRNERTQR